VPEERIDLIRRVLKPAGVRPKRRTAELTGRDPAAGSRADGASRPLPNWGIKNYVDYQIRDRPEHRRTGLWSNLHAAPPPRGAAALPFAFPRDGAARVLLRLDGVVPVQ